MNRHSGLKNFAEPFNKNISSSAPVNYGVTRSSPCSSCSFRFFRTTLRLLLAPVNPVEFQLLGIPVTNHFFHSLDGRLVPRQKWKLPY